MGIEIIIGIVLLLGYGITWIIQEARFLKRIDLLSKNGAPMILTEDESRGLVVFAVKSDYWKLAGYESRWVLNTKGFWFRAPWILLAKSRDKETVMQEIIQVLTGIHPLFWGKDRKGEWLNEKIFCKWSTLYIAPEDSARDFKRSAFRQEALVELRGYVWGDLTILEQPGPTSKTLGDIRAKLSPKPVQRLSRPAPSQKQWHFVLNANSTYIHNVGMGQGAFWITVSGREYRNFEEVVRHEVKFPYQEVRWTTVCNDDHGHADLKLEAYY